MIKVFLRKRRHVRFVHIRLYARKYEILNKSLKMNIFFGLNNILNEKYASQILINASGFGGNAPRYYYPGNPINYYTGININYNF